MLRHVGSVVRRCSAQQPGAVSVARRSISSDSMKAASVAIPPPSFVPKEDAVQFPVWYSQTIQWGDMDAFQHVNNVVYFRYFENARISYLFKLCELSKVDYLGTHAIGPIMADAYTRFRRPVTFPDTLAIGIRAEQVKSNELYLVHQMFSEKMNGALVAEGRGRLVSVDYPTGKKADFPASIVQAMATLQPDEPSLSALLATLKQ
eukprot:m.167187 g.167187  ORF g.167187 m.167187 type:complete len:205 (-) comp16450_c2_seq2:1967-2581(-)